jgi:tRNA dimethylallyltransferase
VNFKIIVIVGPTASGKTDLALKLARKIGKTSVVSIDSRQAYKGLSIITGQDVPQNFYKKGEYYTDGKTRLWAVNFLSPEKDINISSFTDLVFKIIKREGLKRNIILVGGSGLYLKSITSTISTITIPQDQKLRKILGNKDVKSLQKILKKESPLKFNKLNNSDKNNPYRLIRAIEIAKADNFKQPWYFDLQKRCQFLILGIKNKKEISIKDISKRVIKRINLGVVKELKHLLKNKNLNLSVTKTLGFKQVKDYLSKKISRQKLIDLWSQAEYSYYKRQLVWFARQKEIIWYDKANQDKLINKALTWLKKIKSP